MSGRADPELIVETCMTNVLNCNQSQIWWPDVRWCESARLSNKWGCGSPRDGATSLRGSVESRYPQFLRTEGILYIPVFVQSRNVSFAFDSRLHKYDFEIIPNCVVICRSWWSEKFLQNVKADLDVRGELSSFDWCRRFSHAKTNLNRCLVASNNGTVS
jgi:hypothetical protein